MIEPLEEEKEHSKELYEVGDYQGAIDVLTHIIEVRTMSLHNTNVTRIRDRPYY